MPITAIPRGVELRKITAVQKKALDDLITKERGSSALTTAILVGIPSIIAGSAVLAYVFKEEAKLWYEDKKGEFVEAIKEVVEKTGGGIVDVVLDVGNKIFRNDPMTPEVIGNQTFTRCVRWELDAVDVLTAVQKGNLTKKETIQAALNIKYIAKNMKEEGCSRPSAISEDQWKQS